MIILKELRFKNFISYGNNPTVFKFERGITRIAGANYQGKSTLVDAIYYALFGKPFRRINLPNLVNSINKKNLEVQLDFTSGNNFYTIVRGIKPDVFEIYKNGMDPDDLIDQNSTKKGYQQILEDDILKFNEDIFQQIGIKSLTRHDSFLTLPKAKKRQIIENIFGIQVLSEMRDLNRSIMDEIEEESRLLQNDFEHYDALIKQEKKNLDNLKQIKEQLEYDLQAKNEKKLKEIGQLNESLIEFDRALVVVAKYKSQRQSLEKETTKITRGLGTLDREIQKSEIKIQMYEDRICWVREKCNDCPNIKNMEEDEDVSTEQSRIIELEANKQGLIENQNLITEKIDKCSGVIGKEPLVFNKISEIKNEVRRIEDSIETQVKTTVDVDDKNLLAYEKKLRHITEKIQKRKTVMRYRVTIQEMLHDEGIKSYIIKKYLPILNKLMNTYLQKFHIDLELEFTHDLEIRVKTKFKEKYAYESFSEGEKKRINLALTFTFLEFCKLKYSNSSINILLLDEFSIGLDGEGEADMYEILKDVVEKEDKEIITISPVEQNDPEKIDRVFLAKIERGFSNLEQIKEG